MKKFFITLIPLITLLIVLTSIIIFIPTKNNYGVQISKTYVNNSYNNTVANLYSKLIQIEDKLYYNYCNGDCINYGTYEISSNKTRRVYWNGIRITPTEIELDNVYGGKIMNGYTSYLDVDSGKFIDNNVLNVPENMKDYRAFVKDNTWYLISEENLYKINNGNFQLLVSKDELNIKEFFFEQSLYLNGNFVYYQTYNKEGNEIEICKYNTDTKQKAVFPIGNIPNTENGISYMLADEDYAFIVVDYCRLYCINFSKNTITELFETKGLMVVNYYNNQIYVGVQYSPEENGVYLIGLSNQNPVNRLTDIEAGSIYILDDEHIYFTDRNECLYRVNVSEKNIEKVFE